MRENEPVLLVISAYDGKLFLRKGIFYLRNVSHLQHEIIRQAILAYLRWCEVKLSRKTVDRLRAALRTFFLWLQEHFPEADRLDAVSRSIAQRYAQHLAEQVAAGHYSS